MDDLDLLKREFDDAMLGGYTSPAYAAVLRRIDRIEAAMYREHLVEVFPRDMPALREWLARPNGSHSVGRVTFEAVEHGGIFVRTQPYIAKDA